MHFLPKIGRFRTQTGCLSPSLWTDKDLAWLHSFGRMAGFSCSASRCLWKGNICVSSPSSHPCIWSMHPWRSKIYVFTFSPLLSAMNCVLSSSGQHQWYIRIFCELWEFSSAWCKWLMLLVFRVSQWLPGLRFRDCLRFAYIFQVWNLNMFMWEL